MLVRARRLVGMVAKRWLIHESIVSPLSLGLSHAVYPHLNRMSRPATAY